MYTNNETMSTRCGQTCDMGVTERCLLPPVLTSLSAFRLAVALTAAEVGVGDRRFPAACSSVSGYATHAPDSSAMHDRSRIARMATRHGIYFQCDAAPTGPGLQSWSASTMQQQE